MWTLPAVVFSILLIYLDEWMPGFRENMGMFDANKSQLWTGVTGVVATLVAFRTSTAWGRFWEGTGLLHQMRGEWFDTVSNCVTFSILSEKVEEVRDFRHTIVRLMSLCHGSALEEIGDNNFALDTIDTFGLSNATLKHINDCYTHYSFNKVEVMVHLLQSLITKAHADGLLLIPAPIMSRVYQTISRGFVNFLNAKKIQDTKFAFPYAQVLFILLLMLEVAVPALLSCVIQSKILCAFFTFFPIWGLWCLNFTAQELENPFGVDDNDLPLAHFQEEMNCCLMMLLHPNANLIPELSSRAEMDFDALHSSTKRQSTCHGGKLMDRQQSFPATLGKALGFSSNQSQENAEQTGSDTKNWRLSEFSESGLKPVEDDLFKNVGNEVEANSNEPVEASSNEPVEAGRHSRQRPCAQSLRFSSDSGSRNVSDGADDSAAVRPKTSILSEASNPRGVPDSNSGLPTPRKTFYKVEEVEKEESPRNRGGDGEADSGFVGSSPRYVSDLQPIVEKNLDELMKSLPAWQKKVEGQVDDLNLNSSTLKDALQRFGSLLVAELAAPPEMVQWSEWSSSIGDVAAAEAAEVPTKTSEAASEQEVVAEAAGRRDAEDQSCDGHGIHAARPVEIMGGVARL